MSDAATAAGVRYEVRDGVAFVTLAAPPLNILTGALMDGLAAAFERAQADRTLVGVALTADGKAFSAGADVGEHRPENAPAMIAAFDRLFDRVAALELPLVTAVDGAALGGGFELAMVADVLLASERATFGQPEIRLGFIAPAGLAYLAERLGPARAMEITCTGRTYDARTMATWGLVTRVVPPEELATALDGVLADLRRASPAVLRLNVRTLKRLRGGAAETARKKAQRVFLDELMAMEDVLEGIASFYERRRPVWRNR